MRLTDRRQPIAAEPCTEAEPLRVYIPDPFDEPEDWRVPVAFVSLALVLVMAAVAVLVAS